LEEFDTLNKSVRLILSLLLSLEWKVG